MSSQVEALHSSVVNCLTAILNGYAHNRKPAEDELKALEVTEGVCVLVVDYTDYTIHYTIYKMQNMVLC